MSREIKFRAWQKTHKYMTDELCYDRGRWYYDNFEDGIRVDDDWVLMQFTGLKDKTGKEIWEGDVVNVCHINCKGTIVFGMHKIGQDDYGIEYRTPGFVIAWPGSQDAGHTGMNTELEVLGNIYENPELLEEK